MGHFFWIDELVYIRITFGSERSSRGKTPHEQTHKMAKALAREAAVMLDEGNGEAADAIINGLKAEGVEIALATVDAAMRAFGAEGYSDRVDLGDRLQDLNGLRIADGTTDVMRMSVVAKSYGDKGKRLWDIAVKGQK